MKATTLFTSVFLILLVATSCETTEKIDDFPLRPSKLVVNSYFSADSVWAIQVSKSLSVLDNADLQMVNNVSIDVFKNDELIDTIRGPGQDGWYRSDLSLPEAGENYSINVSTPDFSSVIYAEDIAPEPVPISKVSFTLIDSSFYYDHYLTETGDEYYTRIYGMVEGRFNITISDPAAMENYYQLSLYAYNEGYYYHEDSIISYREKRQIYFTTNDPVAGDNDDSHRSSLLFSDDIFNGQNYQLKVAIIDHNATLDKEYVIELLSFTRAGYLYRRSVEDYRNSKGDPFSEPVLIYSNIENGFGIFAGYGVNTYPFQLFIE